MDRIKDALMERETLEKHEFEALMEGRPLPERPADTPPAPSEPERRQDPVRSPHLRPEPA